MSGVTRRFLGYVARGVPYGPDDGTLAPWAVVASLPFAPELVLPTLQHCSEAYPTLESEYGLVCSFNPTFPSRDSGVSGWISQNHFARVATGAVACRAWWLSLPDVQRPRPRGDDPRR